jgi:selenocysteine lyase/cysteine desulfurase
MEQTKMVKTPIYLDYSATTPVDPRVAAKMIPYLTEMFGNPASRSHVFGWDADKAVEEARAHVAALVNADPRKSSGPRAPPSRTTSPSRARRISIMARAST